MEVDGVRVCGILFLRVMLCNEQGSTFCSFLVTSLSSVSSAFIVLKTDNAVSASLR